MSGEVLLDDNDVACVKNRGESNAGDQGIGEVLQNEGSVDRVEGGKVEACAVVVNAHTKGGIIDKEQTHDLRGGSKESCQQTFRSVDRNEERGQGFMNNAPGRGSLNDSDILKKVKCEAVDYVRGRWPSQTIHYRGDANNVLYEVYDPDTCLYISGDERDEGGGNIVILFVASC